MLLFFGVIRCAGTIKPNARIADAAIQATVRNEMCPMKLSNIIKPAVGPMLVVDRLILRID
jgi:hypothetical protein